MKRSILILSFSLVFLIGTIASSPDTVKAAESGWQAAVEDILAILNQDQFQLDIVTVSEGEQNDNTISILLRNDNNKYFRTNISPDISTEKVHIADINNDGHQDIVTLGRQFDPSPTTDMISVFLGNGDGTFQTEKLSPTDVNVNRKKTTAIADFNGDNLLDFIAIDNDGLVLHLGDGTGLFGGAMFDSFPSVGSTGFVVADFDNDGNQDVVASNVVIAYGTGDGTFEAHDNIGSIPGRVNSFAVGDFNNDGNQDVVVATERSGSGTINSVSILFGNVGRTFDPAISTDLVAERPIWIEVGDFNNDGNQDVVTANNFENLSVLLGNGDGTFLQEQNFGLPEFGATLVLVADLNNDGNQDVATLNQRDATVSILFGDGQGHFDPKVNDYRVREDSTAMAIGDFKTLP